MKYIISQIDERGVAQLTLNRPEVHNAFNDEMIAEITETFEAYAQQDNIRLVVLTGHGKSFCAGADLNWMKQMKDYTAAENIQDSQKLAKMFQTINDFPKPVLGRIHGAALGGGAGLVAVCDYVIVDKKTIFGFTEVLLGLIPAVISPYVLAKIGESHGRATFLSGKRFGAQKALTMGLIHEIEDGDEEINYYLDHAIKNFLKAAPIAATEAKKLIRKVCELNHDLAAKTAYTCQAIAERRVHEEGQSGMQALLEKSPAPWIQND